MAMQTREAVQAAMGGFVSADSEYNSAKAAAVAAVKAAFPPSRKVSIGTIVKPYKDGDDDGERKIIFCGDKLTYRQVGEDMRDMLISAKYPAVAEKYRELRDMPAAERKADPFFKQKGGYQDMNKDVARILSVIVREIDGVAAAKAAKATKVETDSSRMESARKSIGDALQKLGDVVDLDVVQDMYHDLAAFAAKYSITNPHDAPSAE